MARTKDVVLAPEQKELMENLLNHLRMATKPTQVVVILSMMM
jgi:hypothetical protein